MARMLLGQILKAMKAVDEAQVQEALQYQKDNEGVKIGQALISLGFIDEVSLTKALARQHNLPMVKLRGVKIPPEIIETVPYDVVQENHILPVKKTSRSVVVASADPLDLFVLDQLRFQLGMDVECVLAPRDDLQKAIGLHYGGELGMGVYDGIIDKEFEWKGESGEDDDIDIEDDDAPIVKLVHNLIQEALRQRASDIHVEPLEAGLRVRYRIDGVCQVIENNPPKRLQAPIMSRLKIMSGMDIAEKRKNQDGRILLKLFGREIDFRVSCIPTNHGESIVLRILDKEKALVDVEELGFHEADYARFQRIIKRPNGILLITGPTGSGKTTTLYAALKKLNRPDVKIITAENPVEYHIDGINQCQVRHNIGLTFGRILRAMLRQAPNIILIGEIRDEETAEIAVQSALTGHLVFSTLHTNDAPSAVTRLIDMGVKPFLVASAVQAIMGQRLLRILCRHCKEPYQPTEPELVLLNLTPAQLQGKVIYKPKGCKECRGTGYHGRKGIFELMEMNTELRELAFNKAPTNKVREAARMSGMVTLQEDGIRKLLDGVTTVDEIIRLTHKESTFAV